MTIIKRKACYEIIQTIEHLRFLTVNRVIARGMRLLCLNACEHLMRLSLRFHSSPTQIFIFDEATSALDTKTEQLIQKNIEEVSRDATTLIIAHRLSTVVHADEIIVLDQGMVAERGTHEELLGQGGVYAQLWSKQTHAGNINS